MAARYPRIWRNNMVVILCFIILALIGVIFLLLGKIYLLHKAALEIGEGMEARLGVDTNTLIDISSRDPYARQLAAAVNVQLRLLRAQRLRYQTGDRELKEAVTGISHDLRTPLTAICGYLDLLGREELGENSRRYLALIENRVDAMKALTEELFRYSVILSTQELTLEPVCINAVLEECIAGFYGALTARGIQPKITMSGRPMERNLNREALGRIFSNIVSNALKYSDGDLDITLADDGTVTFSNTASHLTQVQVGRLFDRFFTVEAARNSGGLGLSIARTLTEQMGGTLTASLQESRLTLTLGWEEG